MTLSAKTRLMHPQQTTRSFDHLVGEGEHLVRHIQAERLGGPVWAISATCKATGVNRDAR
jgi:hypothetical protein